MHRCIPQVKSDKTAKTQDQAVAICLNMWKKRSEDVDMAEVQFHYDETEHSATLLLPTGRPFKLSNVSRAQAEAFLVRYRNEAAAMLARGERGDPLTLTMPAGMATREG